VWTFAEVHRREPQTACCKTLFVLLVTTTLESLQIRRKLKRRCHIVSKRNRLLRFNFTDLILVSVKITAPELTWASYCQ